MTLPWVLFLCGLAISPAYLWLTLRPESWVKSAVKTAPLGLFAAAAAAGGAPAFLTVALVLSALGDAALSREGRAYFLYGLSSFGLAHLVFVLLFQHLGAGAAWEAFAITPLVAVAMLAAALSSEIWLAPYTARLRWPVRLYVALITVMGLTAFSLPPGFGLVALGAVLFMASDGVLSLVFFRLAAGGAAHRWGSWALWVLYIAAVAAIFLGASGL
ncbi:membrane protein [Candidatus Rhodobacter oscarellae]|uniref:Membrane protein n=1 Tax=Candidatus Rhodobacter oscarellae TaxID=1675527 RepID=A0A0J9E1A2_9RHOB|nr:membrane protein [Candidatus Rhodobacter lobularis]